MTISVTRDRTQQAVMRWTIAMLVALLTLMLAHVPPAAAQSDDQAQLGIKPVGVDGSYFAMTMAAGEARQLTVEVGNFGTRDAVAMVYPANVYSLVNGGMGVRLAEEPTSGTTDWLGLEVETIALRAGEGQLRTFAVSVPDTATPGEYISSIVVQDATPAEKSEDGGVVANRVNRQAIAVAVTVPGPIVPALSLGAVEHHVAGGRSVITVEVVNRGNVRLQPSGEFILSTASGTELARVPVTMASVYAGTATLAEIPFASLLDAGEYGVVLSLADPTRAVAVTTPSLPLIVAAASVPVPAAGASVSPAATVSQPGMSNAGAREPSIVVIGVAVAALTLLLAGTLGVARLRWRATTQRVVAQPLPATPSAPALLPHPVTIRQLSVPRRRVERPASDLSPTIDAPRLRTIEAR